MGKENELAISIRKKFNSVASLRGEACISRVPKGLRKVKQDAYTPQVVSIGPYHHGKETLKAMEEHKLRYVSYFFHRETKHSLEEFVESLKKLEAQARNSYEQPFKYQQDQFVEIMLLDGCFIIELILKCTECEQEVVTKDPLFRTHSMLTSLRMDMLLLENQLPFFVLERLFSLYTHDQQDISATFLGYTLFFFQFGGFIKIAKNLPDEIRIRHFLDHRKRIMHFLHLFRACCLPPTQDTRIEMNVDKIEIDNQDTRVEINEDNTEIGVAPEKAPKKCLPYIKLFNGGCRRCLPTRQMIEVEDNSAIPSATELDVAGIKFCKATEVNATRNWPWGLEFNAKNGVFEIPVLWVQESTEILLRNLIAYEQCFRPADKQYITLYVYLMDSLIHSPDDVAKLRQCGIIENMLDTEQVCTIFNNISKGTIIFSETKFYHTICKNVNHYYKTPWNTFRAMLLREYFYSPWSTASSIAVIIVVLCTIVQTLCTIDSWSKKEL